MTSFYGVEHKYSDQTWGALSKMLPYAPEPYQNPKGSVFCESKRKGKGINVPTPLPAPGATAFSKLEYKPEPYNNGGYIRYKDSEMAKKYSYSKAAFGSRDFTKTDEFAAYSRMTVYREQVAKELKVAESALAKAAAMTLGYDPSQTSRSDDANGEGSATFGPDGQMLPPYSPMRSGSPSRSTMLRSRNLASPTQYDRLRDHRTVKEVYNTSRLYKGDHQMDFGSSQTANMAYAEDLPTPQEMRDHYSSPNKRVAVTKQFYRPNGVWAAVTGAN